jgi:5-methylthioadenosine/S-adenosylhomocysteine deaminase
MSTILIENGAVLTINPEGEVYQDGYLFIEDDHISDIAEGKAPDSLRSQASEIIDASNQIVMPGLVNSHVHLFQTLIRGLSDNRPLLPWLEEVAFPVYEKMDDEDIWLAIQLGVVENIRGGSTAVIDDITIPLNPDMYHTVFKVVSAIGLRYKMARGYSDTGYPDALMEPGEDVIANTLSLHDTWCRDNDMLAVDFSPNVVWSTTKETLRRIGQLAQELNIGIHIHTAEDDLENDMCVESTGLRQIPWLDKMGVLGSKTQLAHGIWFTHDEISLIAERGSCVVHNPVSNMFIATGVCPVEKLEKKGIPVALGSDGQAVNNGQEMLDVLKWAANLQKIHHLDASILPPERVLEMACMGGAYAFGLPDHIGSLEPGKKADLILVDLSNSRMTIPTLSLPSLLVNFGRSDDVTTTIVDGKILMRDREFLVLDEDSLLHEFKQARTGLLKRSAVS